MEAPQSPNSVVSDFVEQALNIILHRSSDFSSLSQSELDELADRVEKRARKSTHKVRDGYLPISLVGRCEVMAYSKVKAALSKATRSGNGESTRYLWGRAEGLNTKSRFRGSLLEEFVGEALEDFAEFYSEKTGTKVVFQHNRLLVGTIPGFKEARFKGFVSEVDFSFEFYSEEGLTFELGIELKRKNKSPEFDQLSKLWYHDFFSMKFFALKFDRLWMVNAHPRNSFQMEFYLSGPERTAFAYELAEILKRWNADEPSLRPNSWYCRYCDFGRSGKCPLLMSRPSSEFSGVKWLDAKIVFN